MNPSASERTGWRDEKISLRHRQWGFNLPAVDLDFIMLEYSHERVCCLVEYKNEMAAPQYPRNPSYRAMIDLADRAEIPFIVCRYATDLSWWRARPLNQIAKKYLQGTTELSEKEWVDLLYRIRGQTTPLELFSEPIKTSYEPPT